VVGVVALRIIVHSTLESLAGGDGVAATWIQALERELALWGTCGGFVLTAVDLGRLWHQTYAFYGGFEPVTFELVRVIANDTLWGSGWKVQVVSAAAGAVMFAAASRSIPGAWTGAAVATVVAVAARPLTGHAAEQGSWLSLAAILQIVHVAGATLWIGALFTLMAIGLRRSRSLPAGLRARALALMVSKLSPLALGAATALFVAGCATSFLYVGSAQAMLSTTYGWVLLAKMGAFAVVLALGYVNWQRTRPRLDAAFEGATEAPEARALLLRAAGAELCAAAVVLLLTAVLVALPMPMG
jgi:putative copper export protein